jgi:L-amino acid N-acyltransferase YncA
MANASSEGIAMSTTGGPQAAPEIHIRAATTADREGIVAVYEDFERKDLPVGMASPGEWLDALATSPNFVALANDTVVAHAYLRPDGEEGEVAVFVHPDYRGQRIGRRLLGATVEEARHLQLRRVWGITEAGNTAMLRLARSLGFIQQRDSQMFWLRLEPPQESQLVITSPPLPQA